MAGAINLQIDQGATFAQGFQWQAGGVPINLTGYTGSCVIRRSAQDSTVVATASVVITDPLNGRFIVTIDYHDTAEVTLNGNSCYDKTQCVFDVYFTNGISRYRVINGYAMISPEVTKEA